MNLISTRARISLLLSIVILFPLFSISCRPAEKSPERQERTATPTLPPATATVSPSKTPLPTRPPTEPVVPTSSPTPSPTFTPSPVPDWGEGKIYFDVLERSFGERAFKGIYRLDIQTGKLAQVMGSGHQLLDVSSNYQRLLVSRNQQLFTVGRQGEDREMVSEQYLSSSPHGAQWVKSTRDIVYIAREGESNVIYLKEEGGMPSKVNTGHLPVLIHIATKDRLVWGSGACTSFGECTQHGLVWSDYQGEEIAYFTREPNELLSCQTPSHYVYAERDENQVSRFHIKGIGEEREKLYWLAGDEWTDCAWAPDKTRLAVMVIDRGSYSGSIQDHRQFYMDVESGEYTLLPGRLGETTEATWSPDGEYTLFTGTKQGETQFQVIMRLMHAATWKLTNLDDNIDMHSPNHISIHHLFWLP